MYQVFELNWWIRTLVILIVLVTATAIEYVLPKLGLAADRFALRILAIGIEIVIIRGLLSNWLWRALWRAFPVLQTKTYPDLNGTYEVTIRTNWPIKARLHAAAKRASAPFDLNILKGDVSELMEIKLSGIIKQSWFRIFVELRPAQDHTGAASTIKQSRTLLCLPIKGDGDHPARLGYIFEQENQKVDRLDDEVFPGAALLYVTIDKRGRPMLDGKYWTLRSWRRGLNPAGLIEFRYARD